MSWRVVRPALLRFAERGDLGEEVLLDGSIPSQLLMLGDFDREIVSGSYTFRMRQNIQIQRRNEAVTQAIQTIDRRVNGLSSVQRALPSCARSARSN